VQRVLITRSNDLDGPRSSPSAKYPNSGACASVPRLGRPFWQGIAPWFRACGSSRPKSSITIPHDGGRPTASFGPGLLPMCGGSFDWYTSSLALRPARIKIVGKTRRAAKMRDSSTSDRHNHPDIVDCFIDCKAIAGEGGVWRDRRGAYTTVLPSPQAFRIAPGRSFCDSRPRSPGAVRASGQLPERDPLRPRQR